MAGPLAAFACHGSDADEGLDLVPRKGTEFRRYGDADCAAGTRCHEAAPVDGVQGLCRANASLPACVGDPDCPWEWTCEGETLGCTACGCEEVSAPDAPGQCQKVNGFGDVGIWVDPDVKADGDHVRVYFTKGAIGTDSNWLTCRSYEVQASDPNVGWVTVAKELCADEGNLTELEPGAILERPGFTVKRQGSASTAAFRLRATYLHGCEGKTGPSQCEGGPYEFFSPATYFVK